MSNIETQAKSKGTGLFTKRKFSSVECACPDQEKVQVQKIHDVGSFKLSISHHNNDKSQCAQDIQDLSCNNQILPLISPFYHTPIERLSDTALSFISSRSCTI